MTTLDIKTNGKGIRYALTTNNGNVFAVYKECENYSRTAKGGTTMTWRYVKKDMPLTEAMALFAARTK